MSTNDDRVAMADAEATTPTADPRPDAPASTAQTTSLPAAEPLLFCPECGLPAQVEWRDKVPSTEGLVVHVKVHCFGRHWFLMPEEGLQQGDIGLA